MKGQQMMTIILIICIILLLAICIILEKFYFTQLRELQYILDMLQEINEGNTNRRIFIRSRGLIREIAFEINHFVESSTQQIIHFQESSENRQILMTGLSHDIRTPLTTLIGYLDAIHKSTDWSDKQREYAEIAREKAFFLKTYVDDLFEWFKLNSNEEVLESVPTDIIELTRSVLDDWIIIFEEHKLNYDINIPECYLVALLDCEAYQRIINNLIQNVISHSQASKISISLHYTNAHIYVVVTDNGVGIAPYDLRHIFDRLYKSNNALTNHGSGIGLNIVQTLMHKMNGEVTAHSKQGEGCTFELEFPRSAC